MEGFVTVEITGEDSSINGVYYAPANTVQYINDSLVNISSNTIYLYKTPSNSYPQIRLQSNQNPVYYYQSGYNTYSIPFDVSADQVHFNLNAQMFRIIPYYQMINVVLLLFLVFTRIVRRTKSW